MIEGNLEQLASGVLGKVKALKQVLDVDVINFKRLRRLSAEGIPDEAPYLREIVWKLLFRYIPDKKSEWKKVEQANRQTYKSLVNKFLLPQNFPDYPIILTKEHPEYNQHFKDYQLWEQIQKDVVRTHSHISFFSQRSFDHIIIPYLTEPRKEKFKSYNSENNYLDFLNSKQQQRTTYNYDYMTRILFVYSKLNHNVGYVQGMNEILAPIFFVINRHKHPTQVDEASCFFMLNTLLAEVIDLHIADMDGSRDGIYGRVNLVNNLLQIIEPVIWLELKNKDVDPICYNFKWLALLFAQEFELFDICRLWDTLLTYKNIKVYLVCLSLAIVQLKQKQIQDGDSVEILKALQDIRGEDVREVIEMANQIYRMIGKKNLETLVQKSKRDGNDQDI